MVEVNLHREEFDAKELVKVEGDFVILNSGGPLLKLECIEGDNAIVTWMEGSVFCRRMFPVAMLSRLVPLRDSLP